MTTGHLFTQKFWDEAVLEYRQDLDTFKPQKRKLHTMKGELTNVTTVTEMDHLIKATLGDVYTLLDVGCGIRPQGVIKAKEIIGIDAYKPYVDQAQTGPLWEGSGAPLQKVILGDITKGLPFPNNSFQIVWVSDVIEHLTKEDGKNLLKESKRVASKGVIIRTPYGFLEQNSDGWDLGGDHWQKHRSGWIPDDFDCFRAKHWVIQKDDNRKWAPAGWFATWMPVSRIVNSIDDIFTDIYNNKRWSGPGKSGPGSTPEITKNIVQLLPKFLHDKQITSLLDLPCGDYLWMQHCDHNITYTGADIVPQLIEENRQNHPTVKFDVLNIINSTLPTVDAILVRDCFVHLPNRLILRSIQNIVDAGIQWLIVTHFPGRKNIDIRMGDWRPLDMTAHPISLPDPDIVIIENNDGEWSDKCLGCWDLNSFAQ